MFKVFAFIIAMNFVLLLTDGIYENTSAFTATVLTISIDEDDTTLHCDDTTGFASGNSTVTIDNEDFYYTSKTINTFTVSERGYNDTNPDIHTAGAIIYDRGAGMINALANYDAYSLGSDTGEINIVSTPSKFGIRTLPKMLGWDYGIFQDEQLIIIRYFLMAISGALTLLLALQMLGVRVINL